MTESLSLFFPMYNEEGNIDRAVASACEVLPRVARRWEVIVVDDGSTDRTAEIGARLVAADDHVRLVQHERNRGYGAAVRSGFESARLALIFFADGDNQFDLGELPQFIAEIDSADVIAGYRITRRDPFLRRLNARLYNGLVSRLFDIGVRDVNCAFKVYRRALLDKLELRSTGALINVEMLARARKHGAVIREVGVHHYPREVGAQTGGNPKVILRAIRELFGLYWELR